MGTKSVLLSDGLFRSFVVLIAVVFLGSCSMHNESDGENRGDVRLKTENARAALVAMVEAKSGREIKFLSPDLAPGNTVRTGTDTIRMGRWYCNLAERRFVGSLEGQKLVIQYIGIFNLNDKKQWEAVITEEIRAEDFD